MATPKNLLERTVIAVPATHVAPPEPPGGPVARDLLVTQRADAPHPEQMVTQRVEAPPRDHRVTRRADAPARELSATPTAVPPIPSLLAHIGRFTILERLGEGAMGIVYAAYDDQLDRKVAVKVLRNDSSQREPQARERMLREAQAMARVSHPNIVAVHEVGYHDGEVFIAMEFVRGQNLATWLKAARPWRARVETLLQAGRGLAVAHAAGLVHRDFKPANVIVGSDGVVKVLDFGLARAVDREVEDDPPALRSTLTSSLDHQITHTGAVVGTPAYMAPELLLGQPATDKSDQFSFCVSLYEALYDTSPFDTSSLLALTDAVTRGAIRPPPAGSHVPAALLQIITRGLSVDPQRRFPSMPALLAALERTLERRRTSWLATAGLAGVLAAAGFAAAAYYPAGDACEGASDELVGLWDGPAAAAARQGLLSTGVPFADDTWTRVQARLDAYAGELVGMREDACRAHQQGRASTRLFDLRTACLDQRHKSLAAFVAILQRADAEVVGNAGAAAANLPPLAACDDTRALTDAVPPPDDPASAARVAGLRGVLAEAQAHELAGQFNQGLALVEGLELGELAYPPLVAEIGLRRGSLLSEAGRHTEALDELTRALQVALASGHDVAAAALATRRDFVRAARLQQSRDVLGDAPLIDGLVARVESTREGRELRGDHLNNLGIAHAELGQIQAAGEYFVASLDARRAVLGEEHPQVVYALGNLGLVLLNSDNALEGVRQLRAAFTAAESSLGPKHPHVALLAINLGIGLTALHRFGEAAAYFQRALALQTELLGPDAADLHWVLTGIGQLEVDQRRCNDAEASYRRALQVLRASETSLDPAALMPVLGLGKVAACRRDLAAAERHFQRAHRIAEQSFGADELRSAEVHDQHGDALLRAGGDPDAALAHYQRGLEIREARLPAEAPSLADSLRRLAQAHRIAGRLDEAAALLQQAQDRRERGSTVESTEVALIRLRLGDLALARDDPRSARAHYERAIAIYTAVSEGEISELAQARFGLARARAAEAGVVTPEDRRLAEQALRALQDLGPAYEPEQAPVRDWLTAYPPK